MCINASTVEGERARDDASQLFLRGFARKRRSPGEIISMEKRIRNSITAEEQEAYRAPPPKPSMTISPLLPWMLKNGCSEMAVGARIDSKIAPLPEEN